MAEVVGVMPCGPGREENVVAAVEALRTQSVAYAGLVIVEDGEALPGPVHVEGLDVVQVRTPNKHEPGLEQPRNIGTRLAREFWPDERPTHVHFIDSDVVLAERALEELLAALAQGPEDRIVVAPYEWLPAHSLRPPGAEFWDYAPDVRNDPRWAMFRASPPEKVYREDLSAGLACFSGNLLWPISEFVRVGGFWNDLHHGRCEDGELGLRAVAMNVGISFAALARGYHLGHAVDHALVAARNERDVPMLNERHPWVTEGGVFMVDRDGKAFDVRCPGCGLEVATIEWWAHAESCGVLPPSLSIMKKKGSRS